MTKETFSDRIKSGDPTEDEPEVDNDANLKSFMSEAQSQVGTRFEMGAEASVRDDDPDAFDSSELVQWAAGRAGVTIRDGSWNQYHQLYDKGSTLDVETALRTPGALVFRFPEDISSDPNTWDGRPPGSHVAISLGDGRVLEATTGGVRIAENGGRFTHGGSIPEITGTVESIDQLSEVEPSQEDDLAGAGIDQGDADSDVVDEDWTGKALDLRKRALDKSQEAEERRAGLERVRIRRDELEEQAEQIEKAVKMKFEAMNDNSGQLKEAGARAAELGEQVDSQERSLAIDGQHMDPDALAAAKTGLERTRQDHEDAVAELGPLHELDYQSKDEWAEEMDALSDAAERLIRFDESFTELEAEATSLLDEAQALRVEAVATVTAALPGMDIKGSPDDFVVARDPGTLSGPVSPERLREWLAERNESARQRENFAGRSLGEAEIDEDLADSYFGIAGEARVRAASERAGIETDRALLDRLGVRKAEAEALEQRLADEAEQEGAQLERLREMGDTSAAEAAADHVTRLIQREFEWSGQVSSLEKRIETAQESIDQREEDATEYDQLATEFTELAERHQGLADGGERLGAELHDEIDKDDFVTDKVEDAFAEAQGRDLDLDFHLIDGRSDTEFHIEVDIDAAPESMESTVAGSEESATSADNDVPLVSAAIPEVSTSGVEPHPILEETLESDELDLVSESDEVTESPEPVEFAVLEEQPPESEFEDQLDVAEALEDSLDDLLDDQA